MSQPADSEWGYQPISRKMVDSGEDVLWESPEPFDCRSAWVDLIFLARFAPGMVGGEYLLRGEVLASVRFLQTRWRWGRGTVHAYLKKLEKLGHIAERRTGQAGRVYALVNYDTWNPTNGKARTPTRTPTRTRAGHLPDKDKKVVIQTNPGAGENGAKLPADIPAIARIAETLNAAMRTNPAIGPFRPVRPDLIAGEWLAAGIPLDLIIETVTRLGREFKPSGKDRQISSLKYCDAAVRGAVEADDEARYEYLAGEARRGMDMADVKKYPDWPKHEARFRGRKRAAK